MAQVGRVCAWVGDGQMDDALDASYRDGGRVDVHVLRVHVDGAFRAFHNSIFYVRDVSCNFTSSFDKCPT